MNWFREFWHKPVTVGFLVSVLVVMWALIGLAAFIA